MEQCRIAKKKTYGFSAANCSTVGSCRWNLEWKGLEKADKSGTRTSSAQNPGQVLLKLVQINTNNLYDVYALYSFMHHHNNSPAMLKETKIKAGTVCVYMYDGSFREKCTVWIATVLQIVFSGMIHQNVWHLHWQWRCFRARDITVVIEAYSWCNIVDVPTANSRTGVVSRQHVTWAIVTTQTWAWPWWKDTSAKLNLRRFTERSLLACMRRPA